MTRSGSGRSARGSKSNNNNSGGVYDEAPVGSRRSSRVTSQEQKRAEMEGEGVEGEREDGEEEESSSSEESEPEQRTYSFRDRHVIRLFRGILLFTAGSILNIFW